jgi:hypothetical protein
LGALFDRENKALMEALAKTRESRFGRMEKIIGRLNEVGVEITIEEVLAQLSEGATLGRPHLADALVLKKVVKSRDEAFELYLSNNSKVEHIFIFIIPLLAGWVIGDLGRWINITSFCIICFASQIPLRKKINSIKFIKQPYQILCVNLLIITIITIYLLFIRIPHCCDLEKKNLGIWGGFFNKIITIIKVVHDTKGNLREIKLSNYSYLNK